jgi:SAM-dependent methyltransferase
LAESLGSRLRGGNVAVVNGDATAMPFSDEHFSSGLSFTMLHHVPSRELQDQVLREVWRVLKPGGIFVGSDSLDGWRMRLIHIGDTLVPIDPVTFGARLVAAGFEGVIVEKSSEAFRFYARRPMGRLLKRHNFSGATASLPIALSYEIRKWVADCYSVLSWS